jgi:hypothetical protein
VATEAIIFQQIVDINWDQAIYTASPNNTINVVQFAAKGSGTNIGIALTPKGTGYISAHVPTGTAAGGNARGANSVDLQTLRNTASEVASGTASFCVGSSNTASGSAATAIGQSVLATGLYSFAQGFNSTASAQNSVAIGSGANSSGRASVAIGNTVTASGNESQALGFGCSATATRSFCSGTRGLAHFQDMRAHASSGFSGANASGEAQEIAFTLYGKTTTNAAVELFLESSQRATLRAGTQWTGIVHVQGCKSDGTASASYHRQVTIRRVGNTTSLIASNVVGADTASGTSVSITADDTNESLDVEATGVLNETWRWIATFHGGQMVIGS